MQPASPTFARFRLAGEPSPELATLLACAAVEVATCSRSLAPQLRSRQFDWDRLLLLTRHHRLIPVVHTAIGSGRLMGAPESFREFVAAGYRENAHRALRNAGELLRIFGFFEREKIPVLALKGPALAVSAHGGLTQRHAGDIDLLVPEAYLGMATEGLRALGYVPDWGLRSEGDLGELLQFYHHIPFDHEDGPITVELHWRLSPHRYPTTIMPDEPWKRPLRVPLGMGSVTTLAADLQLLFLCEHGSRHAWKRFFWLQDLALLLHRIPQEVLADTVSRAMASHAARPVVFGLWLARELLDAPLPKSMPKPLYPRAWGLFPAIMTLPRPSLKDNVYDSLGRHRYRLSMMTRFRDRVSYVLSILRRPESSWIVSKRRKLLNRVLNRLGEL